jgi:hypothetical protein
MSAEANNEEVLCHYLSYSPEQVRGLEREGVLKRASERRTCGLQLFS